MTPKEPEDARPFRQTVLLPSIFLFFAMLNLTLIVAGLKDLMIDELGGREEDVSLFFSIEMVAYIAATTLYTLHLKKIPMLDVLFLAGFYTLRVLAGGAATGIEISPWLIAFSISFFLSLAFVKRNVDLRETGSRTVWAENGSAYTERDLNLFRVLGVTSGFISVVVLALYIHGENVHRFYSRPDLLWLICPGLLYWVCRVSFLAHRGEIRCDPIVFALKDSVSYVLGILTVLLILLAAT